MAVATLGLEAIRSQLQAAVRRESDRTMILGRLVSRSTLHAGRRVPRSEQVGCALFLSNSPYEMDAKIKIAASKAAYSIAAYVEADRRHGLAALIPQAGTAIGVVGKRGDPEDVLRAIRLYYENQNDEDPDGDWVGWISPALHASFLHHDRFSIPKAWSDADVERTAMMSAHAGTLCAPDSPIECYCSSLACVPGGSCSLIFHPDALRLEISDVHVGIAQNKRGQVVTDGEFPETLGDWSVRNAELLNEEDGMIAVVPWVEVRMAVIYPSLMIAVNGD